MGSLGFTELLVLIAVVILLFGSKRIPELAKGLGSGIREFKGALRGEEKDNAEHSNK